MTMNFEEFISVVSHANTDEARFFKPYSDPLLNSHHPDIKDDVFMLIPRGENFEIIYPNRDDACREKLTQEELAQVFDEREWENFIPYNPDSDILEWLEHPVWTLYAE